MATTTTRRRGATAAPKPKPKPKPKPEEVEEIDDLEEDEVEDLDDEEPDEEEKPPRRSRKAATKKKVPAAEDEDDDEKPARKEVVNGTQWLAEHVNKVLGTEYKAYDLRVILRKLAKDGTLEREVGSDRSRYDFAGPNDPIVKAVVRKLKSGELEKTRKEKLADLKTKKRTKAAPPVEEDDEVGEELSDEDEVDELDDDE